MIDSNDFDCLEGAVEFVLKHQVRLWELSSIERHRIVLHCKVQNGALWIKAMTHVWRDAGMEPPMPTFIIPGFIVPDPESMDLFEQIIKQQYPALQGEYAFDPVCTLYEVVLTVFSVLLQETSDLPRCFSPKPPC